MRPVNPRSLVSAVVLASGISLSPVSVAQDRALVPEEVAATIRTEGLERSRVMQFQDHLCNQIGGRLTGSAAFDDACRWARDEFAAMGLDARLEQWDEWRVWWDRGQWMGRMVEPEAMEFQVATPAWSAPTRGLVRGPLHAMPEDAAGVEDVAARLAQGERFYLFGAPPGRRSEGAVVDAIRGWIDSGAILGTVQSAASTGYADARYANQIRVFGDRMVAMRDFDDRPRTPSIVLRDDHAEALAERLGAGEPVVVEFDLRNRFRRGPVPLHNVVADLVGSERPEEMVIVCAHLDSWHQATGATDNGTGVCSTLEAARLLTAAGARPRRTIRFILWGGEEQGLLGSRQYVVRHRREMHRVSAVFNHDSGTNHVYGLRVTEAMQPLFERVFAPVLGMACPDPDFDGPVFELSTTQEMAPAGGGSDHASFATVGVPAWSWPLRGQLPYGYGWHSQWDTYAIVVPEYQAHNATVFALAALGVANLDGLLPREKVLRRDPNSKGDASLLIEAWLGIEVDVDLRVTAVEAEGLGARAGLAAGDRLTGLFGETAEDAVDLARALRAHADDAEVRIEVERAGSRRELKVAR